MCVVAALLVISSFEVLEKVLMADRSLSSSTLGIILVLEIDRGRSLHHTNGQMPQIRVALFSSTPLGVSINRPGKTCVAHNMGVLGEVRIKSKAVGVYSWAKGDFWGNRQSGGQRT